ncbi:hypothetical protein EME01_05390 [Sinorhizobium meliloti]|nr:hypothetical protein EME01_05390 [Sinorhizobium meliloti]
MIFAVALTSAGAAQASCVSPAAEAGTLTYDLTDAAVEYCNGTNWIGLRKAAAPTCTGTTGTWTPVSIGTANTFTAVAYGAGKFVLVAQNGSNRIRYSTDGVSWTNASPPASLQWMDIIFANNQFVVITSNSSVVMTSPDGVNWTQHATAIPEANNWAGLTYGGGYYVAVARSGTNRVARSADGITWTVHAAAQANQWFDVAYGNGRFVAVTTSGTNQSMTSTDGANWTVGTIGAKQWQSVTYGNDRFVAVASNGPNNISTSTDGLAWVTQSSASPWINVDYTDGQFVALADETVSSNNVMTSPDGLNWTLHSIETGTWYGAAAGNGTIVILAGLTATNRIAVGSCNTGQSYDWATQSTLTKLNNPSPGTDWDLFGETLAMEGPYLAIRAAGEDFNESNNGYVWVRDSATGAALYAIAEPQPFATSNFGWAMDMQGGRIAIGAPDNDTGANQAGRAWIFNAANGALLTTLANPAPTVDDIFGSGIALYGNLVAVGAPYNDTGATNAGTVYVFNATTGALTQTIDNPAPGNGDLFGSSLALEGNNLVIGAVSDDPGGTVDAGSAYVYNASTGALISTWNNPLPSTNDEFGQTVGIANNIALVTAGTPHAGVAYTFNPATGTNIATLTKPGSGTGSEFGYSSAISGPFAAIGAFGDQLTSSNGRAFIYNTASGALLHSVESSMPATTDSYATGIALDGGLLAVGDPRDTEIGPNFVGAVHIYSARSYCNNPSGLAGTIRYNADRRVLQWCDGSNWHAAGPVNPGSPTGGCASPSRTEGFVMFNSNSCTMQYCDGGVWQGMSNPDACACIASSDLVAHWKLNETTGTSAADSSGNGNTGTLQGGMDAASDTVAGQVGTALNFNGSSDYINLGSSASLDDLFVGGGTISAWIYPESYGNFNQGRILDKGAESNDGWTWKFVDSGGSLMFYIDHTSTVVDAAGMWATNTAITLNTWTHVAVTFNQDDFNNVPAMYINGQPVAYTELWEPTAAFDSDATHNMYMGVRDPILRWFDGRIDDVRVYNRVLTAAEIDAIYNSGTGCE